MGWGGRGWGLPEALRWCYLLIHGVYADLAIEPILGEALRFNRVPASYTHPSGLEIKSWNFLYDNQSL